MPPHSPSSKAPLSASLIPESGTLPPTPQGRRQPDASAPLAAKRNAPAQEGTLLPPQETLSAQEGTLRPSCSAPLEPSRPPRILDASAGFDLSELADYADFEVPSTVVGDEDEDPRLLEHRTAKTPEPGQRVGRYLTEEILGKGGMGLVLRARDDLLQRNVAIKVILPQYLASDPAAGLRFLREAEIVARLDHPHIIRVLDAGLDAGVAYLTFEYIEGETYTQLRRPRGLEVTEAVDLMLPVVSAVSSAHGLGVVHGDLKPSNLILSSDYAGRPHPWVLDFGVSFFSNVDAGLDPTRKKVSGTPGYMAPEWLDHQGVDGRADCFSLGCVLYELLAGKGPFAGISRLSQAVSCAKSRDYPALTDVSRASAALARVVDRSLCPEVQSRVQSAAALGLALLPFASAELQMRYRPEFEGK